MQCTPPFREFEMLNKPLFIQLHWLLRQPCQRTCARCHQGRRFCGPARPGDSSASSRIDLKRWFENSNHSFTYVQPNAALASGESCTPTAPSASPYLDAQVKDRGYKLVTSGRHRKLPHRLVLQEGQAAWMSLSHGSSSASPNDPTNGGRVLLLLQEQGPDQSSRPTRA